MTAGPGGFAIESALDLGHPPNEISGGIMRRNRRVPSDRFEALLQRP